MHTSRTLLLALAGCVATNNAWAHQPVMDMAPRWEHGYGFQIRFESYGSATLLNGDSEINNLLGQEDDVKTTWLEGIYTFRREVRLSVKIPHVNHQRKTTQNGAPVRLSGSGLGDIIIGVPLKRYTNDASATRNIAFTPSIRLPTGSTSGDFPVGDGSIDLGVSFSASFEKADLYQYYDLFYWINGEGDHGIAEGDEAGLDVNIGWHPYHDNVKNEGVFLMVDASLRFQGRGQDLQGVTGGKRLSMGPVFVYYLEGMMFRAEYKIPLYEDVYDIQVSRGAEINIGIGFVF
jgi:hypothetical protein